jgi:cobalamin biosynthesis Mg chelatase CobN
MGSHTWFYRKLKDVNREILITDIIEQTNKLIPEFENSSNPDDQDYANWLKALRKSVKQNVNNLTVLPDKLLEDYYLIAYSGIVRFHNNALYVTDGVRYHDLFRRLDYPDDVITSYEDAIKYIENPNNEVVQVVDNCYDLLKQFWTEFPDGIIAFE